MQRLLPKLPPRLLPLLRIKLWPLPSLPPKRNERNLNKPRSIPMRSRRLSSSPWLLKPRMMPLLRPRLRLNARESIKLKLKKNKLNILLNLLQGKHKLSSFGKLGKRIERKGLLNKKQELIRLLPNAKPPKELLLNKPSKTRRLLKKKPKDY